jgi:hypothetical protein
VELHVKNGRLVIGETYWRDHDIARVQRRAHCKPESKVRLADRLGITNHCLVGGDSGNVFTRYLDPAQLSFLFLTFVDISFLVFLFSFGCFFFFFLLHISFTSCPSFLFIYSCLLTVPSFALFILLDHFCSFHFKLPFVPVPSSNWSASSGYKTA